MVTFYILADKKAIQKFFSDMTTRGEEARDKLPEKMRLNYINPSCLWNVESKGNKHKIVYFGFPFGNFAFFLLFKLALKTKYKERCKRIKKSEWNG
jgi:hypothetical protein